MNTALWLLLNYEMCLQFWLIFCGGLHKLYSSSLMKENALWQSQTAQVIKESAKIYLESQITGTLYSLCKTLACVFPHIFLCIFLQLAQSCPWLFVTPWIAVGQASRSITNSQSLLKPMSHQVSDAIQPSHPLSSPSPPAPNPPQHQGLFQWVSSLHEVAKVLEFQLQHQSFQWIFRTDFL